MVTRISESDGGCPPYTCSAEFRLDVDVTSPDAPGPGFQVCIGSNCFPTWLPWDPNQPWFTQSFHDNVTIQAECGGSIEVALWMNPGLGFINIASGVLFCASCE